MFFEAVLTEIWIIRFVRLAGTRGSMAGGLFGDIE